MDQKVEEIHNRVKENLEELKLKLYNYLNEFRKRTFSSIVNPAEFTDYLDVRRKRADLRKDYKVRGFFTFDDDKRGVIFYDKELSLPELRYTLLHELAHYILLEGYKEECVNIICDLVDEDISLEPADEIEETCDIFAMRALMPAEEFKQAFYERGYDEASRLNACADYFGVEYKLAKRYARMLELIR